MKKLLVSLLVLIVLPLGAVAYEIDYPEGYTPYYNEESAQALARLLWAEGRGVASATEQAAILWCVINRVEAEGAWSDSILGVLTQPYQFAYRKSTHLDPQLYELAKDVLIRWDMERCGYEEVGRVLPLEYCWFTGDGRRNYFRPAYSTSVRWDWRLDSPYGQ